ncbi:MULTISPECIES: SDR family NAD(P)-dependent oxidoreductase [unclassified Meridianimarinicoccus]|uniref:SDR family NAD(P)-dependent oxidoreductase n=1 Tax=unclassified Meridianimarinicoccus TaxID=2923344 RepID=UPI001866E3D9|nr:SDR family NAD(P)-dependent oxidoreductase [Fluviibacterium sp. MJW13]
MSRTILITGCSSGIGAHAARALHEAGWRVFATCRAEADAARLRDAGLEALRLDYRDSASMTAAVDEILSRTGGRLDALFNNGAHALPAPVEDIPTDGLRDLFEVNFFGWHELTRLVLPAMRAQGQGRIVMCSSVLGFVPAKWRGAYVASKYAIEGYSDVLRLEMREFGIHVSLIQPGPIRTDFRKNAILQFERWIDWRNSPRAAQYEASLLDLLHKGSGDSPFQLPPSAVTQPLIHALTAKRPRRRYRVTTPTRVIAQVQGLLPAAALDRLYDRA